MNSSADKLCVRLAAAAAEDRSLCIWRELGNMTLQVVGSTAYGVDFSTMEEPSDGDDSYGARLVKACMDFFTYTSILNGSVYGRLNLMLPELRPLFSVMATVLPDKGYSAVLQARHTLYDVSTRLISSWKSAPGGVKDVTPAGGAAAADAAPVKPKGFLGLLLDARSKASGDALTDIQIIAQSQTFILAGYETTANALAFTIYLISRHPEVEAELLREVDAFGRHTAPRDDKDMAQFPYTEAVFAESLRLYPPAHTTNRHAPDGLCLGRVTIPKGAMVFLSINAIHHDPEIWPRCEEFLPQRFLPTHPELGPKLPSSYLPFGLGSRMCVGVRFAKQEAKLALVRLYQQFTFTLDPGQVPLAVINGITMSPRDGVFVKAAVRPGWGKDPRS
ncbi:MAG: hypothetical protein WDW36_006401 [Sanguina aurantia]